MDQKQNKTADQQSAVTPVPLLDVSRGNSPLREEILAAIARVCDSGGFVFGPDCQQLEESVASLCDVRYGIGCASGSDALLLSLMALNVGPGDEVIVPSFTFFATASCVWRLGARPVFVDIDPQNYNIDPRLVEAAITPATKAIIPVHLFGQCADMAAFDQIGQRYNVTIIEDAAQAIGAGCRSGQAGGLGDLGCFSFYPTKNLGGYGDGGMITTNREDLAESIRRLRNHGMHPRYYHADVGVNSRLDSIQAAVLNVKLAHLQLWTGMRRANAQRYTAMLSDAGLADPLILPNEAAGNYHVWNQYTVRVAGDRRDALRAHLGETKIGSEIYYPVPLHQQKCFAELGHTAELPETERAAREVLSLPIFPELTPVEQQRVVARIKDFYRGQARHAA